MSMSTEPLDNSNEPEIDEIEAALSNLEVTLEAGHTDKILVNIFLKTKCFHLHCSRIPVLKQRLIDKP